MCSKLRYQWLRYFNHQLSSKKQRGFILPLVIMTGLVIVIVGLSLLVEGTNNRTQAISKVAKDKSSAVAEAALARSTRLIAKYPFLVSSSKETWLQVFNADGSVKAGAENYQDWQDSIDKQAKSNACYSDDIDTEKNQIYADLAQLIQSTNGYTNLVSGNSNLGQIHLHNYIYDVTTQSSFLAVQGKVPTPVGETQIEETLSIIKKTNNGVGTALRLKNGGVNDGTMETSSSTLQNNGALFSGNVVFDNCGSESVKLSPDYIQSVTNQRIVPSSSGSASVAVDDFPDLPAFPTSLPIAYHLGNITNTLILPRATDSSNSDGNYEYIVTGVSLSGNKMLTINVPQVTTSNPDKIQNSVILYLTGDMSFSGNSDLNTQCTDPATGHSLPSGDCADRFRIYGYKGYLPAYPGTGQICLRGQANLYGHIVAPFYALGKTGNGTFYGSIAASTWGKIPNCGSHNGSVAVYAAGTPNPNPPPIPHINQVIGYSTKEVEQDTP